MSPLPIAISHHHIQKQTDRSQSPGNSTKASTPATNYASPSEKNNIFAGKRSPRISLHFPAVNDPTTSSAVRPNAFPSVSTFSCFSDLLSAGASKLTEFKHFVIVLLYFVKAIGDLLFLLEGLSNTIVFIMLSGKGPFKSKDLDLLTKVR